MIGTNWCAAVLIRGRLVIARVLLVLIREVLVLIRGHFFVILRFDGIFASAIIFLDIPDQGKK